CGFGLGRALQETRSVAHELKDLRAVRDGRAYVVDGNSYFSRPGPRLVDGIELAAALLHSGAVPLAPGRSVPLS
ncbi:MAG TPA: BtuF-related (seleno)protein, partial [Gaiellaceae bacterium]|nr:BtuF-related (seleno)protein [Gaiellaceae bacterium]